MNQKVVILAASPKPAGTAASDVLAAIAADTLRDDALEARVISVRETLACKTTDEAFAAMAAADALLIVFPLYIFCLPGITMRFLQMYQAYAAARPARKSPAVYAVVNCGFPEPEINAEAARVVGRFACAIGARYRFGVLIGSGPMVMLHVPPVKKMLAQYRQALLRMKAEIRTADFPPAENVALRVGFPRRLYFLMADMGWKLHIRKSGGQARDLRARPYQP